MIDGNQPMGRQRKLKEKRIRIGSYFDESTVEAMDEYVFKQKKERREYSRSDFVNEAVVNELKRLTKGGKRNGDKT